MDVKTCKQCGELKPITQFRRYYGGRRGTYTMCKACERINSREKYLQSKRPNLTEMETMELAKIHYLWDEQIKLGLQPPSREGRRTSLNSELDDMLAKYSGMAKEVAQSTPATATQAPYELTRWLTEKLEKEPDYYLDEVYENLLATFRPCIGINKSTMMPEYDNTHKEILDRILERFNDYEDSYYDEEE